MITMRYIFNLFIVAILTIISVNCKAQTAGERLFAEGQKLQMTQTVSAQNKAIAKFTAAKKAFDSATKKSMCDNQIKICRNNISTIKSSKMQVKKMVTPNEILKDEDTTAVVTLEPEIQVNVELSLSVSSIEFKSGGKKKDNHQVKVICNFDDWTYVCPNWISVTRNGNTLTLTASANEGDEERSGVMVVSCKDKKAELMVYQGNKFKIKSLFGKMK